MTQIVRIFSHYLIVLEKIFRIFLKFFEKSVDKVKFLDYYKHIKQKHTDPKGTWKSF